MIFIYSIIIKNFLLAIEFFYYEVATEETNIFVYI